MLGSCELGDSPLHAPHDSILVTSSCEGSLHGYERRLAAVERRMAVGDSLLRSNEFTSAVARIVFQVLHYGNEDSKVNLDESVPWEDSVDGSERRPSQGTKCVVDLDELADLAVSNMCAELTRTTPYRVCSPPALNTLASLDGFNDQVTDAFLDACMEKSTENLLRQGGHAPEQVLTGSYASSEIAKLHDQILEVCRTLEERVASLERRMGGTKAQSMTDVPGTDEKRPIGSVPRSAEESSFSFEENAIFTNGLRQKPSDETAEVLEFSFTAIVYSSLRDSSVDADAIDGFRVWRAQVGQHVQYMDRFTSESLATRVCRGDTSLQTSETQMRKADEIDSYLNKGFPFNGPLMCLLAAFTWTLTVSKDLQVLSRMFHALAHIPHGTTTNASIITARVAKVHALSRTRFLYICLLLCLQAALASVLLVSGIQFVVMTLSIEEILLNAVALEYILKVHELLFILMPRRVRCFVAALEPLCVPEGSKLKTIMKLTGVDVSSCFLALVVLGSSLVAGFVLLIPHISDVRLAREVLCGGFKDFAYSDTSAGFKALQSIISTPAGNIEPPEADKLPSARGPGWSVEEMGSWPIPVMAKKINFDCLDFNMSRNQPSEPFRAFASLRDATSNQSISSCVDVMHYCNSYTKLGTYARLFCPESCGCNRANSSLVLHDVEDGCSESCHQTQIYMVSRLAGCFELPAPAMAVNPTWQNFITGLLIASKTIDPVFHKILISTETKLRVNGCDGDASFINATRGYSLCNLSSAYPLMRSIQVFCPITCRCNYTNANQCPLTC